MVALKWLFGQLARNLRARWPPNGSLYGVFSRDVTAAILVFQNKETLAILVYQTSHLGVEFYSYAKIVFCLSKPIWRLIT